MMEIWKSIPGYEEYEASNLGRIRSLKLNRITIKKQRISNMGYYNVNLFKEGKNRSITVHKLVAMAFLDHTPNGHKKVIDHIDGNKLNNKLENLRLTSHRKNIIYGNIKRGKINTGTFYNKKIKKWIAQIGIGNKKIYLGSFNTQKEALEIYEKKLNEQELYGYEDI